MTRLVDAPSNTGNPALDEWASMLVRQIETLLNQIQNGYQQIATPTSFPTATVSELVPGPNQKFSPFNPTAATSRGVVCLNPTSATYPVLCISGGNLWIRTDTNAPIS